MTPREVTKESRIFNGPDTLTMVTNDNGHSGAPGAQSDTDTAAITVAAVNDAPVLDTHGATLCICRRSDATAIAAGNDGLRTSTTRPWSARPFKSPATYDATEDVLGFVNHNGISGSHDIIIGNGAPTC